MEVCLESYLLVNAMMNLLILGLAARTMGRVKPLRIILAAILGAVCAVLAYMPGFGILGTTLAKILMPALMAWLACGYGGAWRFTTNFAVVMAATMLFGGSAMAVSYIDGIWDWRAIGLTMLVGGALGLLLIDRSRRRTPGWEIELEIALDGISVRLPALVDTGNRLREPISGQPVIIVGESAISMLLPDWFEAPETGDSPECLPLGWRIVFFNALGEHGCLACFRPSRLAVKLGGDWRPHEGIWVAIYPGELPGELPALAPLSVSCLEGGNPKRSVNADDRQSRHS